MRQYICAPSSPECRLPPLSHKITRVIFGMDTQTYEYWQRCCCRVYIWGHGESFRTWAKKTWWSGELNQTTAQKQTPITECKHSTGQLKPCLRCTGETKTQIKTELWRTEEEFDVLHLRWSMCFVFLSDDWNKWVRPNVQSRKLHLKPHWGE